MRAGGRRLAQHGEKRRLRLRARHQIAPCWPQKTTQQSSRVRDGSSSA
jgi:hypothetical protein